LPAGVELVSGSVVGPTETTSSGTITGDWTFSQTGNELSWAYNGAANNGSNDILTHTEDRTVEISYEVRLTNTIGQTVTSLPNTAEFGWNKVNNDPDTPG